MMKPSEQQSAYHLKKKKNWTGKSKDPHHNGNEPKTTRFLDILWLIVLTLWLIGLFVLCRFLSGSDLSPVLRISVIGLISFGGVVVANLLFSNSPRVITCRLQAGQFHAFCGAIKQAAGTLELQEILDSSARTIVEVAGVRGCSIELLDSASGKMEVRSIVGMTKEAGDAASAAVTGMYQKGVGAGEPLLIRDVFIRDFPSVNEEFESLICVPLRLEERTLGAVCIFGARGQKLSNQLISLLSSLGDVVSLSIAHALIYEDLKRLVDVKTKFMFQASHELRSPLTSIQSIARTLLEGHLGPLSERQRDMISRMDVRSQMLSEIVGDLLVLAMGRAELATFKPKMIDVHALLQESVRFFEVKAREKQIELSLYSSINDTVIFGSEEGLRSVITNLLSNSIKYTPQEGRVTLRLFESVDQIVFEISDTGIGIPQSEQDQLFSEFFRAANAKAVSTTGTGLGLAIVKATVEQHSGSIDVESEEGKGTTFRIFLNKDRQRLKS